MEHLEKLDPDAPDDIYEACRGNASRVLQEMNRAGHNVKKVSVKIDMFLRWRAERKAQRRITVGSRGLETPAPRQLIGV